MLLPEPEAAHDGVEAGLGDLQIDAAERVHILAAEVIGLVDTDASDGVERVRRGACGRAVLMARSGGSRGGGGCLGGAHEYCFEYAAASMHLARPDLSETRIFTSQPLP